jgi:hypothetical protein
MSATVAAQVGRIQLELSDVRLALNLTKMAKVVFLCMAIGEIKYIMKYSTAEFWEAKMRGFGFPGHRTVKAGME